MTLLVQFSPVKSVRITKDLSTHCQISNLHTSALSIEAFGAKRSSQRIILPTTRTFREIVNGNTFGDGRKALFLLPKRKSERERSFSPIEWRSRRGAGSRIRVRLLAEYVPLEIQHPVGDILSREILHWIKLDDRVLVASFGVSLVIGELTFTGGTAEAEQRDRTPRTSVKKVKTDR